MCGRKTSPGRAFFSAQKTQDSPWPALGPHVARSPAAGHVGRRVHTLAPWAAAGRYGGGLEFIDVPLGFACCRSGKSP
jgi:hypothetical protein